MQWGLHLLDVWSRKILSALSRSVRALQTKVISTKALTSLLCISCLLFSCVKTISTRFPCRMTNKWHVNAFQIVQLGTESYGVTVDGNDPLEVYAAVKEARDRAARGEGPTLIETISYRLTAHSSDDDDSSYREKEEVLEARKKDPLIQYETYLIEGNVMTSEMKEEMTKEIMQIVNEATDEAENAAYADAESALRYVYAE